MCILEMFGLEGRSDTEPISTEVSERILKKLRTSSKVFMLVFQEKSVIK